MSKCLNAQILIAVPIREAIPVADLVQGLRDQAVLVLGDHLVLVRVDLVVLGTMIVLLVAILVIGLRVVMIGVLMIVRLAVTSVIVPLVVILVIVLLVVMIGAQMIGLLVGTVLALVDRLVRAVMTAVMVGDEAVPVKKILLPASRVMRPSGGVQQFVPAVLVPFVRT